MRKQILNKLSFTLALVGLSLSIMAQSTIIKQDLSIYPKPEKGYKQLVIEVPHSKNDINKRIEFTVGKWMEVDGCNSHGLQGTLEKKDLQGWGYNYYIFKTKGDVFSTQMACPGTPNRHMFVSGQREFVNYNGQLPIVIYVPEGYDVQFRIYKAEEDIYQASEVRQKK
ncbi:ecotin family protein [Pseudopedobacter sp.]|uniref:ecotin n=1 Tax=Pseudopedobacter sp. TaxID=1936787 RepID=UPI003341E6D1